MLLSLQRIKISIKSFIYVDNPGQNFDFSNHKILDKERNLEKRLILKMIEILNNKNSFD